MSDRRRRVAPSRGGFSLLEVILAMAIFVGAVAVLGELASLGLRNAAGARDLTEAQMLCESKLAEITAGIASPTTLQATPFEPEYGLSAADWVYTTSVNPLEIEGLVAVQVTVTQNLPAERRPVSFTLTRWMKDPGLEATTESTDTTQPTTSSSQPSSSSSTSGQPGP